MTTLQKMVDAGLPRTVAGALYSHWGEANAAGIPYDLHKLVALVKRSLDDTAVLVARGQYDWPTPDPAKFDQDGNPTPEHEKYLDSLTAGE